MTLVGWSIVLIMVSVIWAFLPGRNGLSRRRLIPGLFVANVGLAILTDRTIPGVVGTLMAFAFLGVAAWFLIHDLRLGRRSMM
jgi:hypothetical protein